MSCVFVFSSIVIFSFLFSIFFLLFFFFFFFFYEPVPVVGRVYISLFSALEQTRCAVVACDSQYPPKWCTYSAVWLTITI